MCYGAEEVTSCFSTETNTTQPISSKFNQFHNQDVKKIVDSFYKLCLKSFMSTWGSRWGLYLMSHLKDSPSVELQTSIFSREMSGSELRIKKQRLGPLCRSASLRGWHPQRTWKHKFFIPLYLLFPCLILLALIGPYTWNKVGCICNTHQAGRHASRDCIIN